MTFDPLIYDKNGDGKISKGEALNAVEDYFNGEITKDELLEVLIYYFKDGQAKFKLEDLQIIPKKTTINSSVRISVKATNTGNSPGTKTVRCEVVKS